MTQAGSSTTPDKDGFPDPPIRRVDSSASHRTTAPRVARAGSPGPPCGTPSNIQSQFQTSKPRCKDECKGIEKANCFVNNGGEDAKCDKFNRVQDFMISSPMI